MASDSRGVDDAIRELVERIRHETGRTVPDVDPSGPGVCARVLLVLIAPSRPGALVTGVLSPALNPDATARNQQKLMAEAGLDAAQVTWWNAVPWEVGSRPRPTAADVRAGASYLRAIVDLMKNLRVVVAMDRAPQKGCQIAGIPFIAAPNPSPLGLFGGGANRWDECRDALALAAQLAAADHQAPSLSSLRGD